MRPTFMPSPLPTVQPTGRPTGAPTGQPTLPPTRRPTSHPTSSLPAFQALRFSEMHIGDPSYISIRNIGGSPIDTQDLRVLFKYTHGLGAFLTLHHFLATTIAPGATVRYREGRTPIKFGLVNLLVELSCYVLVTARQQLTLLISYNLASMSRDFLPGYPFCPLHSLICPHP